MKKILFFDIDGTLFRNDCGVPESAREAILECRRKGHLVMLCTGRNQSIIPEAVREIPWDGMVAGGGAYVAIGDRVLVDAAVRGDVCQKILGTLYACKCPFYIENSDYIYFDEAYIPAVFESATGSIRRNYGAYLRPFAEFPNRISKITGYPETREHLERLKEEVDPWLDVIIHKEYNYIELNVKGYSKGTGIQTVLEELGIEKENTYGFGDSANDIPMLETVAHGIVMGDAPEELRKKYSATDSIYEDGIANALKKLF